MDTSQIDFCTLGMFILDDIYPRKTDSDQSAKLNVIGGAGTYSAIGARLFCPPPKSKTVGWIVDAGTDLPHRVRQTIDSWNTAVLLRQRTGLTTRGWNAYTDGEHRAFRYLTEKKRITAEDLSETLIQSRSYHMICSASRCQTLVQEIHRRREEHHLPKPLIIWEPVPDLCTAAELDVIRTTVGQVSVTSPNHEELASIFDTVHPVDTIDCALVEQHAKQLLQLQRQPGGATIVIRCGKEGAYTVNEAGGFWTPPYHTDQARVVDPTGGGNGFLGGLALGLAQRSSLEVALAMAAVAASFCIEQVGPPLLDDGSNDQVELWNGEEVMRRLHDFCARSAMT